jgi:hypothetical protein
MAEQQLDAAQISPGIQQVCRERVAQNMRAQRLLDTKLLTQLLAHHPDCVRLQSLGLRHRQYARRISSSFGDSMT